MPMQQREQSVLVVDDEPSIVRLITVWLKAAGFKVAGTALDGKEGLERFRENDSVDLVVSDVVMPQLDGPDMVRETLTERRGTALRSDRYRRRQSILHGRAKLGGIRILH